MQEELIYIQNMRTPRDILLVSNELERLGLRVKEIELGTAAVINSINLGVEDMVLALEKIGFRVLQKQEKELAEEVKFLMNAYLKALNEKPDMPLLSVFLEERMQKPYVAISRRFRKIEGNTIEKTFVSLKMERVKDLLNSSDLSIEEIAHRLNYSSARSLARVFKLTSGLPVYDYRNKEKMAYMMSLNNEVL